MKVIELIDLIYKRKKDNTISHFASKLINKYNLDIDGEIEIINAIIISSSISNSQKREEVITKLTEMLNTKAEVVEPIDILNNTYKSVCKFYHPDNLETGNDTMFKFVQQLREYLWDYKGKPTIRTEHNGNWDSQRKDDKFKDKYGRFPDLWDLTTDEYKNL